MIETQDTTRHDLRKSQRQIGPVTAALQAMHADTPERRELQALREATEARIERDIELLDRLDAGRRSLTHLLGTRLGIVTGSTEFLANDPPCFSWASSSTPCRQELAKIFIPPRSH
ncbi:hypothetical protein [Methylobacterium sp. Leaf123]|uniref:hypothetical protein n=1 Tax=Methylobacterium sp. Leaf123 TaxID=1736264 RepID=UPI0012E74B1D|nr:hypothetical protein [Methylobacterium sp. Leaf123]